MDFLQLTQKTWELCKLSGSGPGGVTGQIGMHLSITNWVQEAYREIQESQPRWSFLDKEATANVSTIRNEYVAGDFGITDFAELLDAFIVEPVGDDSRLKIYGFEHAERFSKQQPNQKPTEILVTSTDSFKFNTLIDQPYDVRFRWQRDPHELVNSNDTPLFPKRFHMAICYLAMEHYAFYDEDQVLMEKASRKFSPIYQSLVDYCAPKLTFDTSPFLR